MPILADVRLFIRITELISPRSTKSLLWRRARDKMLRNARHADVYMHWEYDGPESLENEIRYSDDDPDEEPYKAGDLRKELEKALGRPPRFIK